MPRGHSLNEYVLHRFGNAMYLLTLGIIVFYMFVYLTAELTAIAKSRRTDGRSSPLVHGCAGKLPPSSSTPWWVGWRLPSLTDAVQFVVIVPLLLLSFGIAVFALGGWETAIAPVTETAPGIAHPGPWSRH